MNIDKTLFLKNVSVRRKCTETYGNVRKRTEMYRNVRKCTETYGNVQKRTEMFKCLVLLTTNEHVDILISQYLLLYKICRVNMTL